MKPKEPGLLFSPRDPLILRLDGIKFAFLPEFRFHDERRWRFDWILADADFEPHVAKIAIEVEGGIWVRGRHVQPTGYIKDMEKYNEAVILGWKVLRFPKFDDTEIFEAVRRILGV